jgi:signal peptidase
MAKVARRLAAIVLLGLGLVAAAVLIGPRLVGWSAMVVTSGSMSPTFDPGAVVLVAPVDPDHLVMRDIVTFRDPGGFTTHRIVGVTSSIVDGKTTRSFTTRGDANEDADPQTLDYRNVVGQARFAVPHLGYVVGFVKSPVGAGALAALALFVLFTGGSRPDRQPEGPHASEREAVLAT